MDKLIVRFLKWFSPLFTKQGVDAERLFVIVETKLKMDKRRTYVQGGGKWNKKKENDTTNRFFLVLIIYAATSTLLAIMIGTLGSLVLSMIFFHSYVLFMMAMTLITDFSTVMMDTADNQIILPRPVTSKTLFAARMVHVIIYLLQFAIAMCVIPIAVIAFKYGIRVGLAAIVTSFTTILFSTFLTWFLYMVVLRFSNEQKLKDIITYFQIFMTIFFAAGYQILPRLINFSALSQNFSLSNYSYIAPPVWMATTLEAVYTGKYDLLHICMIILAVGLPVVLFWALNKYLAPSFSKKMAVMNSDAGTIEKVTSGVGKPVAITLSEKLAPLFCKTATEQAAFQLTWKITGRDKQFRLQFYPSIGYLFVFIFIFVFKNGQSAGDVWRTLPDGNNFLWAIYMPLLMIQTAVALIVYNESYQASWVYYSVPIKKPGELITGAIKAVFIKYCIPVITGFFIFSLVVWGVRVIDDFILGFFTLISCVFFTAMMARKNLPFSQMPNTQQQTGRWVRTLIQMVIISIIIGLHYLALIFPVLLYILIPVMIIAAWLLIRNLQGTTWEEVYA